MITQPTVFIIGAGASAPYGFPTGAGLRDLICSPDSGSLSPAMHRLAVAGYSQVAVRDFADQLRDSGRTSVDAFLEHRPDLVEIGKLAIAAALIPFERHEALFGQLNGNGRWYAHLFEQLEAAPRDWVKNALTVITYNYDRSFEYFLTQALTRSFNLPSGEAARLVSAIPTIHLHGQLGSLREDEGGRSYSPDTSRDRLEIAARGIRIVSEANPDTEEFHLARVALSRSERTYILGFGYNRVNMERLKRESFPEGKALIGTCYGLLEGERAEAQGWFQRRLGLALPEHTISDVLRHFRPLRSA